MREYYFGVGVGISAISIISMFVHGWNFMINTCLIFGIGYMAFNFKEEKQG